MNFRQFSQTKKTQIEFIQKTTIETEQNSNAEILMSPKTSPKKIRKRVLFKVYKSAASKTSVPFYLKKQSQIKKNFKNQKLKKKIKGKDGNYYFKSIIIN